MFRAVQAEGNDNGDMWVTQDVGNPDAGPIDSMWEVFHIASQDFLTIEPIIKEASREVKQSLAQLYNAVVDQVATGTAGAPHSGVKDAVHQSWKVITQAAGMTDDNFDHGLSQAVQDYLGRVKETMLVDIAQRNKNPALSFTG